MLVNRLSEGGGLGLWVVGGGWLVVGGKWWVVGGGWWWWWIVGKGEDSVQNADAQRVGG